MIITTKGPQNIGQIAKHFSAGNLFLSPEEYQREGAWKSSQKQLLIDTVFRGLDIPKFYLWKIDLETLSNGYPDGEAKDFYKTLLKKKMDENDDPSPYIYEVVDGQQRIRTFLEFMGLKPKDQNTYRGTWHDVFPAMADTPMAKGRLYSALNPDQQNKFDECLLTVMVLEKAKIDEIRDMFLRLQNGTPLNAQQKRDSLGSAFGKASRDLTGLTFFTTSLPFDNRNSDHILLASQMLLLANKGKVVNCTSKALNKEYQLFRTTPIDAAVLVKANRVVKLLGEVFKDKSHHLNKSYALALFWLFYGLDGQYDVPAGELPKVKKSFEDLNVERMEADKREYDQSGDDIFEKLTDAMSNSRGGADNINEAHEILAQRLFKDVALEPKPTLDPNRNFSFEEKAILYGRCQGRCLLPSPVGQVCGRSIDFDDAVVDHITPHSHGGKTELANGRIAYKLCNISRGNRNTFDPGTGCHLIIAQVQTVQNQPAAV